MMALAAYGREYRLIAQLALHTLQFSGIYCSTEQTPGCNSANGRTQTTAQTRHA